MSMRVDGMTIDIQKFFKAIDPSKTLVVSQEQDRKLYIDFSSVRGGEIIGKLKNKIAKLSPDSPTCALFTGHIGCGKSTELLRLKKDLEDEGFHVVFFASSDDLEVTDVDIIDVLLASARRISQSLEALQLQEAKGFKGLLQKTKDVLMMEMVVEAKANVPGMGKISASTSGAVSTEVNTPFGTVAASTEKGVSLSLGIGEITVRTKNDSKLREKLNQYLAPQKSELVRLMNEELIEPAIAKLKQLGKKGLVVIVDNLDRIDNTVKSFGRSQQEYLFVDQGETLTKLNCHMIYTMPLALKFSNDYGMMMQRFREPSVLPMVAIRLKDGSTFQQGLSLMRQMVLARAFPDVDAVNRLQSEYITQLFDSLDSLDQLCLASGGHVRDLLQLLTSWLEEEMGLPLTRSSLESVIRSKCNEMKLPISDEEWEMMRKVKQTKRVNDAQGYQKLIRSRFVFEYRDGGESWFDVNPILAKAAELQE